MIISKQINNIKVKVKMISMISWESSNFTFTWLSLYIIPMYMVELSILSSSNAFSGTFYYNYIATAVNLLVTTLELFLDSKS